MYKDGAAWADLTVEYKDSLNMIKEVKSRRKNSDKNADAVDCEIAGSMESDLTQTVRELKKKVLHEYSAITEEDILNPLYGLTERQKEVALLRQYYNYYEVANIVGSDPRTIFKIFSATISKLIKLKEQKVRLNGVTNLSNRQEQVYDLYFNKNMKPKQIAVEMNISVDNVKNCLHRIKQKTGSKIG